MLVKIADGFCGNFGLKDPATGIVRLMTRESEPFELADEDAERHIQNGVCIPVGGAPAAEPVPGFMPEPELPESPAESPEPVDLSRMTYRELQALAKEQGISFTGKKRAALEKLIREAMDGGAEDDGEPAPEFGAADPV